MHTRPWRAVSGIGHGSRSQLGEAPNRLDLVGRNPNGVRLIEGDDSLREGLGGAPVQDQGWRLRWWNLTGVSHHMNPGALARHLADRSLTAELGALGWRRAEGFDVNRMVDETARLYGEALAV